MSDRGVRFVRLDTVAPSERDEILALEAGAFTNPWTADSFDAMRSSPASRIYGARLEDGRIVAFCACWLIVDELHIHTITVREDHRRRGLARSLLLHVLADTQAGRATLEVRRSNAAALALYTGLGFEVSAVREGYYQRPAEDALILWLNPSD